MVRQLLEFNARRSGSGIGIVGNEIAPPDLERVHAELRRREIDQSLGHRGRDRMADGAVLAHHVLVLEHDPRPSPVVAAGVGPTGEIDDLVGLDSGSARIDGIRADAGEIVDLPGGDGAVGLDADLRLHPVVARMDVGDKALEPVGDELHRTLEQLRKRHHRHLVGIGVYLDAERAAHVLGDDAHLVLLEPEVLGKQVQHHVRRLGAMVDGQALLAGIPVGDDRARLVGDAGVAAEHKRGLDHRVGFGKSLVGVAGGMDALEREIVAEVGMDHRRAGIERGLGVGDGRQGSVVDRHQFAGVFGLGAAARHHGANRLALPAGAVDRDGVLRRRLDTFEVGEHADPGRDDFRQLRAGDDCNDPGRGLRLVGVDRS